MFKWFWTIFLLGAPEAVSGRLPDGSSPGLNRQECIYTFYFLLQLFVY